MSITLSALQKQRRDTAANWTAANPTLLAGEIGIESDTSKIKIGTGSTAWTSLAYTPWSQLSAYPIVNVDVASNAEIAVSKLADGSARQLLQTAANGNDVEWTSNVDIPGTLDVTSTATFDSISQHPLGAAATPSITFTGDTNTGIYSPGADQLAVTTGGTGRLFIDSSGRLLAGTSTARSNFFGTTLSSVTQIEGTGGAAGRGALSVINNDVSNNPPYVLLGRSGAASLGSNAVVVSGSRLGTVTFHGADGASFIEAATVAGEVDGTPGSNDMPGRLVFSTTADGAASPTERLRIDSTGHIQAASSGTAAAPIYSFLNDPNTGIYSPGADQVAISAGGTARLTTTTTGITSALAVDVPLGAVGTPSITFTGDLNTGIYSPGADQVAISTNGTGRLFVNADGTIVVGSTSVLASPTVYSSASPTIAFSDGTNVAYAGLIGIQNRLLNLSSAGTTLIQSDRDIETNVVGGYPWIVKTANAERMRLDSSGRLGLGTSAPGAQFAISGPTAATHGIQMNVAGWAHTNRIGVNGTSGDELIISQNWNAATNAVDNAGLATTFITGNTSLGSLAFGTAPINTVPTTRLFINNAGRVGIGTTGPTQSLDVNGNIRVGANQRVMFGPAGFEAGIKYSSSGNFQIAARSGEVITFNGGEDGTERARLDSSGRLLVGTSSAVNTINYASLDFTPRSQVVGAAYDEGALAVVRTQTSPFLFLCSGASGTNVSSGNGLGSLIFTGYHTTKYYTGAVISAEVDGTPGANDMPGRLVFSTTADGASSPTERFRISNDGSFSSVIPGGSTLYPRFGCRAWVNFNGSGGGIRASGNVSSVTVNTTGNYTINFSTAMVDANFSVAGLCSVGAADGFLTILATATGSVQVRADEARGDFNPGTVCVSVFR